MCSSNWLWQIAYMPTFTVHVENSPIIMVSPFNALMQDQISNLKGHLNVRILKDPWYSLGQKAEETKSIKTTTIDQFKVPPQYVFAHPEVPLFNIVTRCILP